MRTSGMVPLFAFVALVASPIGGSAQDLAQLVADGRFQEAASLAGLVPEEAEQGATLIFNRAYSAGFLRQSYDYAIDGFAAAKQVPGISDRMREQLNFWHGLSLFQRTVPLARAQDLEGARTSLPGFQQAQALLNQSGAYASTIAVDLPTTMQALGTFIEIQEAIIRRGY